MRIQRRLERIEEELGINECSLCVPGGLYGRTIMHWPEGEPRPVDLRGEPFPDYCPECGRALYASESGFKYICIDPVEAFGLPRWTSTQPPNATGGRASRR